MRRIVRLIIVTVSLSGCASVSLEELEAEAIITGDWAAVESRERALARRDDHDARVEFCRDQDKLLVTGAGVHKDSWSCVSREELDRMLRGLF
jgi:hypothetical protein